MLLDDVELAVLSDGFFRLDGGAMFGIVPKTIWNKYSPADEFNRITLAMRPLLIKTESKTIIVNTGIGNKLDARLMSIFAVDHSKTDLIKELKKFGVKPKNVDMVILTHLHLDHSGWNTIIEDGKIVPTFPNAEYIIQRGEWKAAVEANERTRGSYIKENFLPIEEYGQLRLVNGDREMVKGVKLLVTGGHTEYHQIVLIGSGKQKTLYWSDIMPTTAHLKPPYIMGYDLYPLSTLKIKKEFISQALKNEWLCLWEHDPKIVSGYLFENENQVRIKVKQD